MARLARFLIMGLAIAAMLLWPRSGTTSAATGGPILFTQNPCVNGIACNEWFSAIGAPTTLRSFTFTIPSAGKASATFTGSTICSNNGAAPAIVDFETQIVMVSSAAADANKPSGLRYAEALPAKVGQITGSDSFNLASTRVIGYAAGGQKTITYNLTELRMDANVECLLYDASFSVLFVP